MNHTMKWGFGTAAVFGVVATIVVCVGATGTQEAKQLSGIATTEQALPPKTLKEMTEAEKKAFVEKLFIEKGILDPRGWHFPKTAFEYAKLAEAELGIPPKIDLSESVEIPLYVNGVQKYGNLGRSCDNYSMLGKDTVSGSVLQRHEGRTADGKPLADVLWVSFGRNSTRDPGNVLGSVQMIGYNKKTGATAFFESCDQIEPWVTLDKDTCECGALCLGSIIQTSLTERTAFPTPTGRNVCSATRQIRSSRTHSLTQPRFPAPKKT